MVSKPVFCLCFSQQGQTHRSAPTFAYCGNIARRRQNSLLEAFVFCKRLRYFIVQKNDKTA
jgi:hypothetical protein